MTQFNKPSLWQHIQHFPKAWSVCWEKEQNTIEYKPISFVTAFDNVE